MQLSGLYHQGSTLDQHQHGPTIWVELSDRALTDIGELYSLWDAALRLAKDPAEPVTGDDSPLGAAIIRACHRTAIVIGCLNNWTPMLRWVSVLRRCEQRWVKLVERLMMASPTSPLIGRLQALRAQALERHQRLIGLLETYNQEKAKMAAGFQARNAMQGDLVIE